MDKDLVLNKVAVRKSSIHGFGVFAQQDIQPEEIIEECYCIASDNGKDPALTNYYFKDIENKSLLIVLGWGSIYNHSTHPNTSYLYDSERRVMVFRSTKLIKKNEEVFVSYGDSWFDGRPFRKKEISWLRKCKLFMSGVPLRAIIISTIVWSIVIAVRMTSAH